MPLPPEIVENRSDEREVFALINALRRQLTDVGGGAPVDAPYWVSTANATLTAEVDLGALPSGILQHTVTAGVSTPGVVTVGAGLTYVSPTLDRAALTGDITAAAGSNTTAFRSFAATSVLGTSFAAGVPTEISAVFNGDVLRLAGGVLGFGSIPATSVTGLFYQTIQNAGVAVTQRPIWNASTGLTAVDNGGATRTDVTVNLSTGIAGGQSAIGSTLSGENLTITSNLFDNGKVIFGSTSGLYYDQAAQTLTMGTATPLVGGFAQFNKSLNAGVTFYFSNPNTGGNAYTSFGQMDRTDGSNVVAAQILYGSGSTRPTPRTAGNWEFELFGGAGNMVFWVLQNTGDFVWYTTTTLDVERMRLMNSGMLQIDGQARFTANTTLSIGTQTSQPDWITNITRSRNSGAYVKTANTSTGTTASGGYLITQTDSGYGTHHAYLLLQSSGFTTIGPYTANSLVLEHVTSSAAGHMFFSALGPQDIDFYTTAAYALRLKIANGGAIAIPNLSAGGYVAAGAGTGTLSIADDPATLELQFGYGADNFSGTLPTLAEARPHFWLFPYTYLDNVSAISVGSSNSLGIIEWPARGGFSYCYLDVFVRQSLLSDPGTELTVEVSLNGVDTGIFVTIPDTVTDTLYQSDNDLAVADGDTVGLHVSTDEDYVSGSLIMHAVVRLTRE